MNYELLVDKLMQHFTSGPYAADVATAKKEFFDRAGTFDEQSNDFEMKMAQFADWYLFHRPLDAANLPPLVYALQGSDYEVSEETKPFYENLKNSIHSIFEYQKLKNEDVYIKDLFSGKKYVLKKSVVSIGFNKDELFEARLIPHEDNYIFGRSFCFHPDAANRFIAKEIKKIKKGPPEQLEAEKEKLIIRLFKMRYKHEQYKHVGLKDIYSNESKLRL